MTTKKIIKSLTTYLRSTGFTYKKYDHFLTLDYNYLVIKIEQLNYYRVYSRYTLYPQFLIKADNINELFIKMVKKNIMPVQTLKQQKFYFRNKYRYGLKREPYPFTISSIEDGIYNLSSQNGNQLKYTYHSLIKYLTINPKYKYEKQSINYL